MYMYMLYYYYYYYYYYHYRYYDYNNCYNYYHYLTGHRQGSYSSNNRYQYNYCKYSLVSCPDSFPDQVDRGVVKLSLKVKQKPGILVHFRHDKRCIEIEKSEG